MHNIKLKNITQYLPDKGCEIHYIHVHYRSRYRRHWIFYLKDVCKLLVVVKVKYCGKIEICLQQGSYCGICFINDIMSKAKQGGQIFRMYTLDMFCNGDESVIKLIARLQANKHIWFTFINSKWEIYMQ